MEMCLFPQPKLYKATPAMPLTNDVIDADVS